MDVTPHELRDCQITDAFRGYNRDEVNELMERAAATIETQAEKIRILTERVSTVHTDATRTRDNEDIIQRTLVLAQRAADDAIADANRQASEILADAEARSRAMVDAANDEVRRVHDVERARLDAEIDNLTARRDGLHADVEALEGWEREYRGRVIGQLEADLATARAKKAIVAPPAPVARSEERATASIDISTPPPAPAVSAPAPAAPTPPEPKPVPAPATPAAPAAKAGDIDLTTERAQPAADVAEAVPVSAGIAVAKPRGSGAEAGAPAPLAGSARGAAAPAPQPQPEARLDDDAFFATLRDAVRDDAPLGPADDRLFETERDSSLRDIFKRKR